MEKKAFIIILIAALLLTLTPNFLTAEEPGGIGLAVLQLYHHDIKDHRGPIVVLDVLLNGPALSAGVEKGDIITHVDGKSTSKKDFDYILTEMLRGPAGTSVTLTIRRTSSNHTFNMTLDRIVSLGLY